MRHGASAYANSICRCDICRVANTERHKAGRYARAERIAADPSLAEHGNPYTYTNWGCRCVPCTEANSERCKRDKRMRGIAARQAAELNQEKQR